MRSVLRLGRCCRFLYILALICMVSLVTLELRVYTQLKARNTLNPISHGRGVLGILKPYIPKVPNILKQKTNFPVLTKGQTRINSKLFRKNQKVQSTMEMIRSRIDNGKGGSISCSGNLEIYNLDIVLMRNVILDTEQQQSKPKGGETIKEVLGQKESDEDVKLTSGFFRIPCNSLPVAKFSPRSYFSKWYPAVQGVEEHHINASGSEFSNFTVFVKRGDYANLYWTIIELYNTFLTIKLFNKEPKSTTVVLVDAHPLGKLENLWTLLFGNIIRIRSMRGNIFIKELAWVVPISASPVGQAIPDLPYILDFKSALYQATGSIPDSPDVCFNGLNSTVVTLILRHNYVAHPRNPSGTINRKISNEEELIKHLKKKFSGNRINAVQIDKYPIEEQIRIISQTTVLLGVHGAGLAHGILLRPGTTLFEMFPLSYKKSPNPHFEQFAIWGGSQYQSWYSSDKPTPKNEWIRIPPEIAEDTINKALSKICINETST